MASHVINLKIANNFKFDFEPMFGDTWFDSGGFSPGYKLENLHSGKTLELHFQETKALSGCSGYIIYRPLDPSCRYVAIAIGFSNPAVGTNKLGIVCSEVNVIVEDAGGMWSNMDDHDYKPFTVDLCTYPGSRADCQCSGGNPNNATINMY